MTLSMHAVGRELLGACALSFLFGSTTFGEPAATRLGGASQQEQGGRAENVQFQVVEAGIVRIFYDLVADDPGALLGVRVAVSRDGGQTFDLIASSVTGDVGPAVVPGPGKQIRWDAARDVERLDVERFRLRVVVTAIAAPRPRSSWGVSGSLVPDWRFPSGQEQVLFGLRTIDYRIGGSEFRAAIVRGRSVSGDWGLELVRKRVRPGTFVSRGAQVVPLNLTVVTTYTATEALWVTGAEVYKFFPFLRIGDRQQLGVVVAVGLGSPPGGTVERRIEGAIFASDPFRTATPRVVTEGPGVIPDDQGGLVEVPPGRSAVVDRVEATKLFDLSVWSSYPQVLGRVEMAWAVTLVPRTKLRVSAGLNFPAFQVFSVEMVRFFGP